jgi:hypothetical protein
MIEITLKVGWLWYHPRARYPFSSNFTWDSTLRVSLIHIKNWDVGSISTECPLLEAAIFLQGMASLTKISRIYYLEHLSTITFLGKMATNDSNNFILCQMSMDIHSQKRSNKIKLKYQFTSMKNLSSASKYVRFYNQRM